VCVCVNKIKPHAGTASSEHALLFVAWFSFAASVVSLGLVKWRLADLHIAPAMGEISVNKEAVDPESSRWPPSYAGAIVRAQRSRHRCGELLEAPR